MFGKNEVLCHALAELAEELDKLKSGDGDISWLKWQGHLVKRAITALLEEN
jgi:hypothetical protein